MDWLHLGIICAVCAVCCAIGFKKFVWFLSIGYGFAIIGGVYAVGGALMLVSFFFTFKRDRVTE